MLDSLPISGTLPAELQRRTLLARSIRADKVAHQVVENNLIARLRGTTDQFTDKTTRTFLGPDWDRYQTLLAEPAKVADLVALAEPALCRISPICMALLHSADRKLDYDPYPALRLVSNSVVDGFVGRDKSNLVISVPPRHGKSTTTSRYTSEVVIANYPNCFVAICSYNDEFSATFSLAIRQDIENSPELFGFGVARDSSAKSSWLTEFGGGCWSAGPGGSAIGKGAHLLVLDDLIREIPTPDESERIWNWYLMTARTRLMSASMQLIIMTRWSTLDIAGKVLTSPNVADWKQIRLPALADVKQGETDEIGRSRGEALWPTRFGKDRLEKERIEQGEANFSAVFQQVPMEESEYGKVVPSFSVSKHVRDCRDDFDPNLEIRLSFDFNIGHMAGLASQIVDVSDRGALILCNQRLFLVKVLHEFAPPGGTREMSDEVVEWLMNLNRGGSKLRLRITGDVAGNQRRSSASKELPTDWAILKDKINRYSSYFRVVDWDINGDPHPVRPTVMEMRGYFDNNRIIISSTCRETIDDLKICQWTRDSRGNLLSTISKADPRRSHFLDALRYLLISIKKGSRKFGEQPFGIPGLTH